MRKYGCSVSCSYAVLRDAIFAHATNTPLLCSAATRWKNNRREMIYTAHTKKAKQTEFPTKKEMNEREYVYCVCCVLCAVYSLHTQYYSRRTPVIVHLTESNRIQSNTRRIFSIVSRMLHARQTLGVVMMTVSTSYTFRRDLLWHQNMPHFQNYILYAFCFIT